MPEPIYWTLQDRAPTDLDACKAFLSPTELQKLSGLRFPKRRDEWLLGRLAAKSLVRSLPEYRGLGPAEVEIRNTTEGAPQVILPGGAAFSGCLSISHCGPLAFCGLSRHPALRIGVDIERIEPRAEGFAGDYFTSAELELVRALTPAMKDTAVTLIWSAKEAMLKALGVGLHWDTRRVEVAGIGGPSGVEAAQEGWHDLQVRLAGGDEGDWSAWWQRRGEHVLIAAAWVESPTALRSIRLVEPCIET